MTHSNSPNARFTGPSHPLNTPNTSGRPAYRGSRVVEGEGPVKLPRSVPMLTVYEDGRVTPNSAAVELFGPEADGLCFHPPPDVRPGYTPRLWHVSAGDCHLYRTAGRGGHIQLRAAGDCPPAGRYLFTPAPSQPGYYALVPAG